MVEYAYLLSDFCEISCTTSFFTAFFFSNIDKFDIETSFSSRSATKASNSSDEDGDLLIAL